MRMSRSGRAAGFTLIEITIVIGISLLVMAAGFGLYVAVVDNARLRATQQAMETVRTALQGYVARTGRLPCPSVETRDPPHAQYGFEDPATTNVATSCINTVDLPGAAGIDAAKRGVVPWRTLGIPAENARDGWGNQITYLVSVTSTTGTFDGLPGLRGSLYVHSAAPVAAGLPATGNQINACSITADDNTCNRAALVALLSHGPNGLGAYPPSGVRRQLPTGAGELENTDADRSLVLAEASNTFDDILLPLPPDQVLGALVEQGTIKGERALLLERVQKVMNLMAFEALARRNGTPGNYTYYLPNPPESLVPYALDPARFTGGCDFAPPTHLGVLPAGHPGKLILDPWGREFHYAMANDDIYKDETCLSPAVLASRGPDGVLGTADDWVYYASITEWRRLLEPWGW